MLRFISLSILAAFGLVVSIIGCGDENPSGSPVINGECFIVVEYVDLDGSRGDPIHYLVTLTGESDSLVDSILMPQGIYKMAFAHKGDRACFVNLMPSPPEVFITNWPLTDTLTLRQGFLGECPRFTADDKYILIAKGDPTLLTVPDLTQKFIDSAGCDNASFIPGRDLFCYSHPIKDSIFYVDYGSEPINPYALPFRDSSGALHEVAAFCPSKSGDSLIVSAGNSIFVVRTENLQVLTQKYVGVDFEWSYPVLHPHGDRVFWFYEGSTWPIPASGSVYVYQISTGEFSVLLDEADVGYFTPSEMTVTPDGKFLYLLSSWDRRLIKVRLSGGDASEISVGDGSWGFTLAAYPLIVE